MYTWQDLYCTDDHFKELSLIPPIQYKGTLDVTPLSSASLYHMEFETSENDDSTISTDTSERISDSLFDTEKTATTAVTMEDVNIAICDHHVIDTTV